MFFMARATEPTLPGLPGRQRTTVKRESRGGSSTPSSYQSRYAAIALPVPVRRLFTYGVPATLAGSSRPGSRARVPFGKRTLTGVITSLSDSADLDESRLRDVSALPDAEPVIGAGLLETLLWAARYYVASQGAVLSMALPPRAARSGRTLAHYATRLTGDEAEAATVRAPRQREILALLRESEGVVPADRIREILGDVSAALAALERKGLVQVERRPVVRAPEIPESETTPARHLLTPEQDSAVSQVGESLGREVNRAYLLLGPTGSGKTEVYLAAIDRALEAGKSAIYLVPEISLTPLLARRCRERFGGRFALLHSSLTPAQRREEWERIRIGCARVVLGPRSALMAPVASLGLIVVDEEQDSSFKQESDPRYNGRDLALVRAQKEGAVALLGSATPSLESFRLSETGRLSLLSLSQRIEARPLARVELVDMRREEGETGGEDPVSRPLRDALRECLGRREQAIVFLNRRGWAPALLCRKCGENLKCRRCSISLTWHRRDQTLLCHYCGYRRGIPKRCPSCSGEKLTLTGIGTEKLEEEISALFPGARVARLDRDIARGRQAPGRILAAFERGAHDILVGTQLVAKGHDFPNVTLVGVIGADFTLGFPDFRAAERTFQILTQVAGRAGRGERPGRVIVQAHRPDHYAIQAAASQDYAAFHAKESRYRRLMGYPPFTALACVTATGRTLATAQRRATLVTDAIRRAGGRELKILGPAPAPLFRLKGRYRFQAIVRAGRRRQLSEILNEALNRLEKSRSPVRDVIVDVDPASLL
jgi:primosomal protein N' (replication factor Y)